MYYCRELHVLVVGGLLTFVAGILENIDTGATCPGNRKFEHLCN